eukprot:3835314-Amphidinium_carterae.1
MQAIPLPSSEEEVLAAADDSTAACHAMSQLPVHNIADVTVPSVHAVNAMKRSGQCSETGRHINQFSNRRAGSAVFIALPLSLCTTAKFSDVEQA